MRLSWNYDFVFTNLLKNEAELSHPILGNLRVYRFVEVNMDLYFFRILQMTLNFRVPNNEASYSNLIFPLAVRIEIHRCL